MARSKLKICLTGGPSAGKSTVVEIIRRQFSHQAMAIPEVASILYRGGFPRSNDAHTIRAAQKAIYVTQVEMERVFEAKGNPSVIICDRGTLDQTAYWPDGPDDFFKTMKTTSDSEVSRYDWVLHLHTSSHDYDGKNPVRTESLDEALELDRRIYSAWSIHPRRIEIPSCLSFSEKISAVFSELAKRDILSIPSERKFHEAGLKFN